MRNTIRIGRLTLDVGSISLGVTPNQVPTFLKYRAYQSKFDVVLEVK